MIELKIKHAQKIWAVDINFHHKSCTVLREDRSVCENSSNERSALVDLVALEICNMIYNNNITNWKVFLENTKIFVDMDK